MIADGKHKCPKDGCDKQLSRSILACKPHWYLVSAETRARVNRTWRAAMRDLSLWSEYMAAREDAVEEMNAT